jgi:putative glutamine amidotransferase
MSEPALYLTEDENKPIIGISGNENPYYFSVAAAAAQVRQAGGIPLYLSNHTEREVADDLAKLDGLMILGNIKDMDPNRYRNTEIHPRTDSDSQYPEQKNRADYEFELIKIALEQKVPLLGVCAGMQKINVACGGTLHQHIPDLVAGDAKNLLINQYSITDSDKLKLNVPPFVPVEQINIVDDSKLAEIAVGRNKLFAGSPIAFLDNSLHHQAVDQIGKELIASAYTTINGVEITEAIEPDPNGKYANQFLIGTQWHPELAASDVSANIIKSLVEAAKDRRLESPNMVDNQQTHLESLKSSATPSTTVEAIDAIFQSHINEKNTAIVVRL